MAPHNRGSQMGTLHIDIPTQPQTQTFETNYHGSCSNCEHWHDRVPVKISGAPEQFTGLLCNRCGHKMCGFGGNSTHTSLASMETLSTTRRDTFESVTSSGSLEDEHREQACNVRASPSISIAAASAETRCEDADEPARGRDKNAQTSLLPPSPSLLSPDDAIRHVRNRAQSAPPRPSNDVDNPSTPVPRPSNLPRRGSSFKDKFKKGVKRVVNFAGYDIVRLSPTSPHSYGDDSKTPVLVYETSTGDVNPYAVVPEPSPPRTPELGSSPRQSSLNTPRIKTYRHSARHIPSTEDDISRRRQARTTEARGSQSSRNSSGPSASLSQRDPVLASYDDGSMNSDTEAIRVRQTRSQGSSADRNHSRHELRSPVRDEVLGAAQRTSSESRIGDDINASNDDSGGHRLSMATTAISSARMTSVYASSSALPNFESSSPQSVFSYPDALLGMDLHRGSLEGPFPPLLRISTASEGLSIQVREMLPQVDTEEEDGGATPIPTDVGGMRRSSLPFLDNSVSPDDIHEANERAIHSLDGQSRASMDNESLTVHYGSEAPRQEE